MLGLLQNVRRGIYAWPSLVRSVFVFDEVHSYSDRLFEHLLRFLEIFANVPMLLMTATLPPLRKEALERVCRLRGGLAVCPGKSGKAPNVMSCAARQITDVWTVVKQVLETGGKVLWVSNTVGRAIAAARRAMEMNLPVQPYHSRYRYRDRLSRQRTVVDGFLPEKPPILAVTTQVAEMSLTSLPIC